MSMTVDDEMAAKTGELGQGSDEMDVQGTTFDPDKFRNFVTLRTDKSLKIHLIDFLYT